MTILCTVLLFFFPSVRGPYSAVNGPVTALRSMYAGLKVWLLMALVAVDLTSLHIISHPGNSNAACRTLFLPHYPPHDDLVLRC